MARFLLLLLASALVAACASMSAYRDPGHEALEQVRIGMSRDQALALVGPPLESMKFARTQTESWDYRYHDQWGYLVLHSVIFGPDGRVASKFTQRLNEGGDYGK